jgi:ornithine cyclodeaminase/alanine dehydrogenase
MKTLLLSKKNVEKLLTMKDTIEAVKHAFMSFNKNLVKQPPIVSIEIPEEMGEIDIKCGYSEEEALIAVKSATGFKQNKELYNMPFIFAAINLFDSKTGYPICYMDGSLITGYRTGAAGGVAAQCLARKDSNVVGMIGTGSQAKMQAAALVEVLPIEVIKVFGETIEDMIAYKNAIEESLNVIVTICQTIEEAVIDADIIVTTTPSKTALIKKEWIKPGTHINAIGADMEGKQELDPRIFEGSRIVADSIRQCVERGEIQNPIREGIITEEDIHCEIGEILLGLKQGRVDEQEITIFDTTGMSVQDIFTASSIYKCAVEKGIGDWLEDFNL